MAISNIKNTVIRRAVIVIGFLPLCLLEVAIQSGVAAFEALRALPDAITTAWRGRY